MRVAAYVRVSTDEQADKGNSLLEQKERLEAYCKAMGWNRPMFFEDDGFSAKDMRRPDAQKMIERVKNNEFEIVLTSKLDRMSRNLLDMLQFVKLLEEHNCSYVSASEGFDTSTAVGRMVLQLLAAFAEFERERISERVKDNMMSLARNTDKAITLPCYGYDIVEGKYEINDIEAQYVKLMFELAEEGHGHRMIAKRLNEAGAATKRGKLWDQTNVKRLMRTETIAGIMIYNKRQNKNGKMTMRDKKDWIIKNDNHPAIINHERFDRVQEIFKTRSVAHKHAENETYLLTGLVKCKYCGKNMKGNTSRHKNKYGEYTYFRYICSSYVAGYGCKHHAVHRDDLEEQIVERIKMVATSSENQIKMVIAPSRSFDDEIKELKNQLSKINKKMQKQIEAYENDLISAEDLKAARERVDLERTELNVQLKKLENRKGNEIDIKQKAKDLLGDITGIDRVKSKNAIRLLIDHIIVENDQASVVWRS
ncbi:recombinase family protein [Ferviditalea candida]|uniref:Recombinase family protein n=1 Tax=Ferviditalea candida TaxID=3108399 RepID=A0ABU5ZLA2_9BACL|nr:recombinase family protein [Paenibacillaceae bacterium T2]